MKLPNPFGAKWHKFIRYGRILYITQSTANSSIVTWDDVYKAGLAYGVDGPGPEGGYPVDAPVNQSGIVTQGSRKYRVRLPLGARTLSSDPLPANIDDLSAVRSEFEDLIFPLTYGMSDKQALPGIVAQNIAALTGNYSRELYFLAQENLGGANPVQRLVYRPSAGNASTWAADKEAAQFSKVASFWLPVLELIEE